MSEQRQPDEPKTERKSFATPAAAQRSSRGRFSLWVAALAAVLAILLHSSLFGGRGLVPADGIFNFPPWLEATNRPSNSLLTDQYLVFIPQHEFTRREFLQGKFSLWNPNLECGIPNLASMDGALLFPVNLLLLPVDPFYAGGISAFMKLFLAGWFMMLYMRLLDASDGGSFLAGLTFSLSGFMICWLGHPHVNVALCIPLLLFLIEKTFQYGRGHAAGLASPGAMRVWAGLAVTVGCVLLGGHPPTMVQVAFFTGIYFLFRLAGERQSEPLTRCGLAICAGVVGFFLAGPQLMPFLEYYRHSSMDEASTIMDRAEIHSTINTLILYLFPRLSGSPAEGFEDTMLWLGIGNRMPNFIERTGYVGVLPLMFASCALVVRRGRWMRFYGLTTLVCLLAVFGMPPFPALFKNLPVLKDINPTRLMMIAGFSIAVLAGMGWDSLYRMENPRKRLWLVAGFWAIIGLVLLLYLHWIVPRWKFLDAEHRAFVEPQFFMMAGSLAASVGLLLPSVRRHGLLYSLIGLGWVAADLLVFGRGINPAIPRESYYPKTPEIEWLQKDKSDFRILGQDMVLVPNTAELYGLKDARGYDFMTIRRYEELITGGAGKFFFYRSADSLPEAMPLLSVKYVLTFNRPAPNPPLFELVYSNETCVYRSRQFEGRARTVFDYTVESKQAILAAVRSGTFNPDKILLLEEQPKNNNAGAPVSAAPVEASANIVSDQPDEVTVEASMPRPGFLLLLDTYFPGWKATVNGQSSPVLRADYDFRAVQLPAGKSVVRFFYRPGSFCLGMALFAAGLIILAGAVFGSSWIEKRRISNPAE
jgi:hypothetical protein